MITFQEWLNEGFREDLAKSIAERRAKMQADTEATAKARSSQEQDTEEKIKALAAQGDPKAIQWLKEIEAKKQQLQSQQTAFDDAEAQWRAKNQNEASMDRRSFLATAGAMAASALGARGDDLKGQPPIPIEKVGMPQPRQDKPPDIADLIRKWNKSEPLRIPLQVSATGNLQKDFDLLLKTIKNPTINMELAKSGKFRLTDDKGYPLHDATQVFYLDSSGKKVLANDVLKNKIKATAYLDVYLRPLQNAPKKK